MDTASHRAGGPRALGLAFLAAIIEGFDLQSAGVAAPSLGPAFGLTPGQMGLFFSAATFGLIFGAMAGGHVADRFGRRAGLALALAVYGACSLATAAATSFEALILLRFLTGLGLGGALPNLVSIAAESAAPDRRGRAVSIMYAGVPLGGAVASLVAMDGLHGGWQSIFLVGGILPLILIVPLLTLLPPLRVARRAGPDTDRWRRLMASGSRLPTALLWCGFFFGLLVVYLLLNWLPALLVSRGFGRDEAALVQIVFNLGGAAGSLIGGRLLDSERRVAAVGACFAFMAASLLLLGASPASLVPTLVAGALVGGGVLGAQAILYGIAPQCYAAEVRGTGVGLAVAVGRLGSVAGPLLAGGLVATGRSPSEVLLAIVPVAVVSGVASVLLVMHRQRAPAAADPA